jgi:hypothetical protein
VYISNRKKTNNQELLFVWEVQTRGNDFPVLTPFKKKLVQGLCVHVLAHPIANSTYSHGIFNEKSPRAGSLFL